MTTATIEWAVLAIAYAASTIPLARQGWGRDRRSRVEPGDQAVYHRRVRHLRRARHAA